MPQGRQRRRYGGSSRESRESRVIRLACAIRRKAPRPELLDIILPPVAVLIIAVTPSPLAQLAVALAGILWGLGALQDYTVGC